MYESLNTRAISVSCLLVWTGFLLGFTLLAASQLTDNYDLGRWAMAALLVSCTYSIHRAISGREERDARAFELGRRHEREHLTSVR